MRHRPELKPHQRLNSKVKYILALFVAIFTASTVAAIPSRPEPPRLVNDYAGIFSHAQNLELEKTLVAFDDTTSNQIAVVTALDLEGYDIAEYATRIGLEWQVGTEKFDNGVVVVVKPKVGNSKGEVFIAVGYGLEGAIPDIAAGRIINEIMIPYFMNGDYYGGVVSACSALMKLASGEYSELREEEDPIWVFIGFLIIMFMIFVLIAILADKNGGGNSSSGGRGPVIYTGPITRGGNSFGGFGGSSSGGFGGFGGGSFGGGGARGSW